MQKLTKRLNLFSETVQAYSCSCGGTCNCAGCGCACAPATDKADMDSRAVGAQSTKDTNEHAYNQNFNTK